MERLREGSSDLTPLAGGAHPLAHLRDGGRDVVVDLDGIVETPFADRDLDQGERRWHEVGTVLERFLQKCSSARVLAVLDEEDAEPPP